jgi:hypothetical protein
MGTGSLLGLKRTEHDVDHPPPSSADVKERVELYLYSPVGLHGLFWDDFSLTSLSTKHRKFELKFNTKYSKFAV